ncbi:MAG: tRNA lysidine(34) synthetase TilS [Planctomycetota bacterium]
MPSLSSLIEAIQQSKAALNLLRNVDRNIQKPQGAPLIEPEERVLLSCSGGADSTALAIVLAALAERRNHGWRLHLVYVDHCVRPKEETEADATFVSDLAATLGARFHHGSIDVPAMARESRMSVETCGRVARYDFLERTAIGAGCARVAIAHHKDDQVETVLHRILRGTGVRGLSGIPWRRPIGDGVLPELIRPFRGVRKAEITAFLNEIGAPYRHDSTNEDPNHAFRNRVRLEILPTLRRAAPGVDEALVRLAASAAEAYDFLKTEAELRVGTSVAPQGLPLVIPVPVLRDAPVGLRPIIAGLAVEQATDVKLRSAHLSALVALAIAPSSGSEVNLPYGLLARRVYEEIIIDKGGSDGGFVGPSLSLKINGEASSEPFGIRVTTRTVAYDPEVPAMGPLTTARFDVSSLPEGNLVVRRPTPGDAFRPIGMSGRKKLQDYFVDEKIPRHKRGECLVLSAGGEIAWIIGRRLDRRFTPTENSTELLEVSIEPLDDCSSGIYLFPRPDRP